LAARRRFVVLLEREAPTDQPADDDDHGQDDAEDLSVPLRLDLTLGQNGLTLLVTALVASAVAGVRRHLVTPSDWMKNTGTDACPERRSV